MVTKRIIPCLDVHNGRVVKGVNFVNIRDAGDPVEIASYYDKAGADELTFLDITASAEARNIMIDVVRRVAEQVFIPFTVGGGIRTVEDFREILKAGADKVSINSAAVKRPELISEAASRFGSQCVVVAIDAKRRDDNSGWMCILTEEESIPEKMPWNGLWRLKNSVPGRFFLRAWTVTVRKKDMTLSLPERCRKV